MTGTDRDCECNGLFSSAMSIDVMLIGNRVQDLGYAIGRSIELPVALDSAVNFPPNVLIPKPFCRVGAE